jgi:hypothetical protein
MSSVDDLPVHMLVLQLVVSSQTATPDLSETACAKSVVPAKTAGMT